MVLLPNNPAIFCVFIVKHINALGASFVNTCFEWRLLRNFCAPALMSLPPIIEW
jgi:hypothetical protein